ncbi:MAG: hypothetical protein WAY02_09465 [Burkholderiaceae bacterium]
MAERQPEPIIAFTRQGRVEVERWPYRTDIVADMRVVDPNRMRLVTDVDGCVLVLITVDNGDATYRVVRHDEALDVLECVLEDSELRPMTLDAHGVA